ncbi:gliding motility-associated C-terminal domain-containing protein, partial [Tamlana agarivorans]
TQTVDSGLTTATVTFTTPVGTDNCTVNTTTQIAGLASGSAFPIGTTLITFEVSDVAGNTATCSFNVIVEDEIPVDCRVDAGEDQDITEGDSIELRASTSTSGSLLWTPSEGLSAVDIVNPIANPTETTTYTLSFTSNDGCTSEDYVTVYVTALEEDNTKYGFSPDGDGINEFWEIDGIQKYPNNKVSIFNRWGDLVFETLGYNNTSKVFRGVANRKRNWGADELPEGTYFFQIKIEGSHHLKKETGFLVLKR